jgi:hypothetical protein
MRYTSDIPRDSSPSLLAAPAMMIEDIFHDTQRDARMRKDGKKSTSKRVLGAVTCVTFRCALSDHELGYVYVTIAACVC